MGAMLPPLQEADMPARDKPFWKMTGPGAVMVGMAIGSGELILWPMITARFGATLAWAAALGVFLQLWVNIEVGRWAVATGESVFGGFSRATRASTAIFLSICVIMMFLPAWARASGSALKAIVMGDPGHPSPDWIWTGVTFLAIAALLFGPKSIYGSVEKTISIMVVVIIAGLLYVVARLATTDLFLEMGKGLVVWRLPKFDADFTVQNFFSAVVFAGAGGIGNLFYAYYLRDKQIGMGARIPILVNPMRKREDAGVVSGYRYPETEENAKRFRDWMRFVVLDQSLYFWLGNTFTIFLFMFGALAVLHPQGIIPGKDSLLWDEAQMMTEVMGSAGLYLFLVIGMAALFSTQLALVDGYARCMSDMIHSNYRFGRRMALNVWYVWIALAMIVIGITSTYVLENFDISALDFIFNAALLGGFAMALYCPLLLYVNLKYLPRSARPKPLNIVMMSIASLFYGSFALYCLWLALPFS